MRSLRLLVVVFVALFAFGGCGDSDDDSASAEAETTPHADTTARASFRIIERRLARRIVCRNTPT